MIFRIVCIALLLGSAAHAQIVDPDTAAARRHFERGLDLYAHDQYQEAIDEFRRAKALRNAPAFDYNIARCYDRLEHWREAADAYQRYLDGAPDAPERAALTERIALLRARQTEQSSPPPASAEPPTSPAPPTAAAPSSSTASAPSASAPSAAASVERAAAPRAERPLLRRPWFWGVVGGVAAVVVAGVVVGVVVGSGSSDRSHAIGDVRFP